MDELLDTTRQPSVLRLGDVACAFGSEDLRPIWAREVGAMVAALVRDAGAIAKAQAPQRTRARLANMSKGLLHNARVYGGLFAKAGLAPDTSTPPATSRPRLLETVEATLRDWAWEPETEENQIALDEVLEVWPADRTAATVLVLGAGAGRLGVDLHVARAAERTVLLDANPLPLLVAAQLLRGEPLEIYELPRNPRTVADAAVLRRLHCPHAQVRGVSMLVADGREPPLSPGGFDVVVTPWYIDQVEQSYDALLAVLRRLLRPGGAWVNHGPLIYHRRPLPDQLTFEELVMRIREAGFEMGTTRSRRLPHLHSPASSIGRIYTVHTFMARTPCD